uniref:Novel acetylcholine receptor chaperone n=1 Tax=Moina brachiata TaxID=675436 RepID=A0A4Y7NJF1_9CRUS|nr:EOG090X0IKQ [Moina brachiata]SVE93369.1 EOG090X0IKQ [Moina brachiata]
MASVVLKSLSIFLGLFFIFVGIMKITPYISRDLHKDLRQQYVKYAKIIPLARLLNIKIPSKWYRRTVGGLEVLCGFALTFIPHKRTKQVANVILLFLMICAVCLHWAIEDKLERTAPAIVFFFMLSCRLVVEWQLHRQEKAEALAKVQAAKSRDASHDVGLDLNVIAASQDLEESTITPLFAPWIRSEPIGRSLVVNSPSK